jgi:hypothetical protein
MFFQFFLSREARGTRNVRQGKTNRAQFRTPAGPCQCASQPDRAGARAQPSRMGAQTPGAPAKTNQKDSIRPPQSPSVPRFRSKPVSLFPRQTASRRDASLRVSRCFFTSSFSSLAPYAHNGQLWLSPRKGHNLTKRGDLATLALEGHLAIQVGQARDTSFNAAAGHILSAARASTHSCVCAQEFLRPKVASQA